MTHLSVTVPISVVMCCYNAERWLEESIESVLSQTWRNFEFIIVDDGSTDRTGEIIERYVKRDRRIVPIAKSNTGPADSRNIAATRARGEWIAILDADDVCEQERLARQWCAATSDTGLVFLGSGLVLIDEQGHSSSVYSYPSGHEKLVAHLATGRRFPPHSSAFIRTDAFHRVGGYRTRIKRAEDLDLWQRLSEVGRLACLQEPLIRLRRHSGQISHDERGWRQLVDAHVAMVSYWLRRAGHPDPVESDIEEYERFRSWVADRLANESPLAIVNYHQILEAAQQDGHMAFIAALLSAGLAHPKTAWRFAKHWLFGARLPQHLATQWCVRVK